MSQTYTNTERSLIRRQTVTPAYLWDIRLQGGARRQLTLHDVTLSRNEAINFRPQVGLQGFAIRKQSGLTGQSTELRGAFDPNGNGLTYRDFRGRFVEFAICTAHQVDWRWPFHGRGAAKHLFTVADYEYDDEEWVLRLGSILDRVNNKRGEAYTPLCVNELGVIEPPVSFCQFDKSPYPFTVSGVSVYNLSTPNRKQFEVVKTTSEPINSALHPEEFFSHGYVEWTLGANAGLTEKIEKSEITAATRQLITLQRAMPFDVNAATDLCTLVVGCRKDEEECTTKFQQFQISFRGTPHIPGNLASLRTPAAS